MKRIAMMLCLMAALLGQKGFANYFGSGCNGCSDFSFSVYADYLYWKVTRTDHTSHDTADEDFESHFIFQQPKYSSGYRVGGSIYYNCVDFGIRYTSFRNHVPKQFDNPFIGIEDFSYNLNFQVTDLTLGYTHYFQCHRGYVKPYIGAKLAWLKEDFTLVTEDEEFADQFRQIRTRAYGPMLGVEGSWELFRCWLPISLVARGDISVLNGRFAFERTDDGEPIRIFDNRAYSLIAVSDLFVGLGFDICNFSCFDANLQIGYEAQVWNGVIVYPELISGGGLFTPTTTLGLDGFVARLGFMF